MRNNKGITMMSLIITTIVLIIITGIIIRNGIEQLGIKRINKLYADIDSISTKVAEYYLKNEKLPIYENNKYINNKEVLEVILRNNGAEESDNIINVNDGDEYWVIDLSKLDNLTLNYGEDYKDWTATTTADEIQNLYIINSVTHQIYFPHGVESQNKYYFSKYPDENIVSPIELQNVGDDTLEISYNVVKKDINDNKISITANITLECDLDNYKIDSFKYAWIEANEESEDENSIKYTKFRPDITGENKLEAILVSRGLEKNNEYYTLKIKAMNIYGKYITLSKDVQKSQL